MDNSIEHVGPQTCSFPRRDGNLVVPIIDTLSNYEQICDAIEKAQKRLWIAVSFCKKEFLMPGKRGTFFDVLEHACERDVEVRVLFWNNSKFALGTGGLFGNTQENLEFLKRRKSKILARWDDSDDVHHCHHEKTWIVDAGETSECVFTGGMVISGGLTTPAHFKVGEQRHDIMALLKGPSATDVAHSFVQRWNEALYHNEVGGCWPSLKLANNLEFPTVLSKPAGNAVVQVQRTIRQNSYTNGKPSVGAHEFPIAQGEASIFEQYKNAIKAAKDTIYFENQHIAHEHLLDLLIEALQRGVQVVYVVPGQPMSAVVAAGKKAYAWRDGPKTTDAPRYSNIFLEKLPKLATFDNFCLSALGVRTEEGVLDQIYVHSKLMIVDKVWYTLGNSENCIRAKWKGSANLVDISFEKDHTELNISVWDPPTAAKLFNDLVQEHIGEDVSAMNGKEALRLFKKISDENRPLWLSQKDIKAHAFSLNPVTYATPNL